jgi:hypothetical protein
VTVYGGAVNGRQLWAVLQPVCVLDSSNQCTSQVDSLALYQDTKPSVIFGTSATYFPSPYVGFHAELSLLGLRFQATCAGGFFNPDPDDKNAQVCDDINAQPSSGRAVGLLGGVTVRASAHASFSPYLRGSVGVTRLSRSPIAVHGVFRTDSLGSVDRTVVVDPESGRTALVGGAAIGFTAPMGPKHQFRFEVRDHMARLGAVTGPATAGVNPTTQRVSHYFSLAVGIDFMLLKPRSGRP